MACSCIEKLISVETEKIFEMCEQVIENSV